MAKSRSAWPTAASTMAVNSGWATAAEESASASRKLKASLLARSIHQISPAMSAKATPIQPIHTKMLARLTNRVASLYRSMGSLLISLG